MDEGDLGMFFDCLLMECDLYCLIEGMIIVGVVIGVMVGYIYVCSEYLYVIVMFEVVIVCVCEVGWFGEYVFGFVYVFEL